MEEDIDDEKNKNVIKRLLKPRINALPSRCYGRKSCSFCSKKRDTPRNTQKRVAYRIL